MSRTFFSVSSVLCISNSSRAISDRSFSIMFGQRPAPVSAMQQTQYSKASTRSSAFVSSKVGVPILVGINGASICSLRVTGNDRIERRVQKLHAHRATTKLLRDIVLLCAQLDTVYKVAIHRTCHKRMLKVIPSALFHRRMLRNYDV